MLDQVLEKYFTYPSIYRLKSYLHYLTENCSSNGFNLMAKMTSHARIQQNQVGGEGPDVLDDNVFHRGSCGPPRGQYPYIIRKHKTICGFPGGGDRNPSPLWIRP